MLKDLILGSPLTHILFYPPVEVNIQIRAIREQKKTFRGFIQLIAIIAGITCGVVCFLFLPVVNHFLSNIISAMLIPQVLINPLAMYLSILTCSGVIGFAAKVLIRTCCQIIYGDQEYFLTKRREEQLDMEIRDQGYSLSKKTIRRMVEHCIKKMRSSTKNEIGISRLDWKIALEAILYNSDIEVFLEQQSFILCSLKKTEERIDVLKKYSGALDLDENISPPRQDLPPNPSEALQYDPEARRTSCGEGPSTLPASSSIANPSPQTQSQSRFKRKSLNILYMIENVLLSPSKKDKATTRTSHAVMNEEDEVAIQRALRLLREESTAARGCREEQEKTLAMGVLNKFKYYKCNQGSVTAVNQLLCSTYDFLINRESLLRSCSLPDTEYLVHFMLFMTRNIAPSPLESPRRSSYINQPHSPEREINRRSFIAINRKSPSGLDFQPTMSAHEAQAVTPLAAIENCGQSQDEVRSSHSSPRDVF